MAPENTRQRWVLGALLVTLTLVLMFNLRPSAPIASNVPASRAAAVDRRSTADPALDTVNLAALGRARPEPETGSRNPFSFDRSAPAASDDGERAALAAGPRTTAPPRPNGPTGPPPVAPIALKFIGIVDQAPKLRVAVLSDGRNVFYGREGDTIEGRYRIERIGADSVDMAYVDGRGRQTIRLSGS